MPIHLKEPSNFRYIHINPATNRVHLLVPFIAGIDVSTDNTCKADVELKAFFEGGAFNELESYKSTLEFHLLLLEEGDENYRAKKERLEQINRYIEAVVGMRNNYRSIVYSFLSKPSNLYSIQLRPTHQDPMSRVVNPVFTINRSNDSRGTPLSPLYNKMHEVFRGVVLGKADPVESLIQKILEALPSNASFETIQDVLAAQYGVPNDFFKKRTDENHDEQAVNKENVDTLMGFGEDTTSREYIKALLGLCAPNLQSSLQGSPFYFESSANPSEKAERLSMLTQFYLGYLNVYCRAKKISDKNFGEILDKNPHLSHEIVELIAKNLSRGKEVEPAIIEFFNQHKNEFKLTRELNAQDKDAIVQKFETSYRTVTATKENPHMDDFMFLDTEAQDEQDIFITNKGLICTDAANIIQSTPKNQAYLTEIRLEAPKHRDIVTPQDEPVITIDIEPEALMDKLSDVQWERLPKEVVDAFRAHPAFKVRQFLDDVAKGKQGEAQAILESSEDKQTYLRTPGNFTDYSRRTFHCTAYEYAYWAKDRHMMRMLEHHMNDETKAFMLGKIDAIEKDGLSYQQHGFSYQNAHYDMSFILKDLSLEEFIHLKVIIGQSSEKLNTATPENYKTISFTADEYQALIKTLKARATVWDWMLSCLGSFQWLACLTYPGFLLVSCFITLPAQKLLGQLKFDFNSLITALDSYVTNYDKWHYHEQELAWMRVGEAQRDVPAHVAHEYCRPDRSFDPLPSFTEEALPRVLNLDDCLLHHNIKLWFPLSSSSSGLGFDFALTRGCRRTQWARGPRGPSVAGTCGAHAGGAPWRTPWLDLAAVRHLDEVRIADLTLSRENLSRPAVSLVHA